MQSQPRIVYVHVKTKQGSQCLASCRAVLKNDRVNDHVVSQSPKSHSQVM